MGTLVSNPGIIKVLRSLPEIWYITLFTLLGGSNILNVFSFGWNSVNGVTTLLSLAIVVLLVVQLFKKLVWSRFLLGALFTFGSLFMFIALLSEYSEFPLGTEPNAINLIIGGILVIGPSFLLAGKMLIRGVHNVLAS